MVQEGEALKNEVVELHDQVLVHEVTNGDLRKEIVDLKERHENMEFMMNVSCSVDISGNQTKSGHGTLSTVNQLRF